jgi:hypothetical protein
MLAVVVVVVVEGCVFVFVSVLCESSVGVATHRGLYWENWCCHGDHAIFGREFMINIPHH